MSREIKFQAMSLKPHYGSPKWYPVVLIDWNNQLEPNSLQGICDCGGVHWINLDWDTLRQYTGLKDKNGREIYEGDIVTGCDVAVEYKNCLIKFFNGSFLLMGTNNKENWIEGDFHSPEFECEVIGNIYENPELLEKTK